VRNDTTTKERNFQYTPSYRIVGGHYHDMCPNDIPDHFTPLDILSAFANFGFFPFPFVLVFVRVGLADGGSEY